MRLKTKLSGKIVYPRKMKYLDNLGFHVTRTPLDMQVS
jgi:hypothetical protein